MLVSGVRCLVMLYLIGRPLGLPIVPCPVYDLEALSAEDPHESEWTPYHPGWYDLDDFEDDLKETLGSGQTRVSKCFFGLNHSPHSPHQPQKC
jgi:hypothetical protein